MSPIAWLIIGVVLLFLELWLPTFGILALASAFSIGVGVWTLLQNTVFAPWATEGVVLAVLVVFAGSAFMLWRLGVWRRIELRDTVAPVLERPPVVVGSCGVAHTVLRPIGVVVFDGVPMHVDVQTQGEFIDRGMRVQCVYIDGKRVIVEKAKVVGNMHDTNVADHTQ
jgi:membrane-bound serine protease (ClpP class)